MTNFVPIFPLGIAVFPGEQLNLHIFEDRYKELINECFTQKKPFGIPSVIKENIGELGTLVNILEIVKTYEDGKIDVRTEAISIFRILEIIKTIPDKLYSGAIVNYPANLIKKSAMMQQVFASALELHRLLKINKDFKKTGNELLSYDIAHHVGLTLEEEYELLGLFREDQRLEYLKRHLNEILPMIAGIENLKEKIKLNGHFRELKGFNFG